MARDNNPRYRRTDILSVLPHGSQQNIARLLKCKASDVSKVLNGQVNQDTDIARNIIRYAEQLAEKARERQARKRLR